MTESVLEDFKDFDETWRGNIAADDAPYRTDGRFMFRLDRAVQRRGTHRRNENRGEVSAGAIEKLWDRYLAMDMVDWHGEFTTRGFRIDLIGDDGDLSRKKKAIVDSGYLSLAHRLLQPDAVSFMPQDIGYHPVPVVVFYRSGEPCGLVAQLRGE